MRTPNSLTLLLTLSLLTFSLLVGCTSGSTSMRGSIAQPSPAAKIVTQGDSAPTPEDQSTQLEPDPRMIDPCKDKDYLDTWVAVSAVVEGVQNEPDTRLDLTFLDIGGSYPEQCLTLVIFDNGKAGFPEQAAQQYRGKKVWAEGYARLHNGKPYILIEDPDFIKEVR